MSHIYDPSTMVQHLNTAVKDTDETVADMIMKHDFSDSKDKKWLVWWITKPSSETWKNYEKLKTLMHSITTVPRINLTLLPNRSSPDSNGIVYLSAR